MRKCVLRGILLCIIISPHHRLISDEVCWRKSVSVHVFFCVVVCSVSVAVSQNFLRDTLTMEYIHRAVFSCEFLFISASRTILFFPLWVFIYCECISLFFFQSICASRSERKKSVQRFRPAYAALCGREHA